jgi:putative DNA primase/helicase
MLNTTAQANNNHEAKHLNKVDVNDLMQQSGTDVIIEQYRYSQEKSKQQEQQQKSDNSNNKTLTITDLLDRIYHNLIIGESISSKKMSNRIMATINNIFNTSKTLDIEICKHFNPENKQCYIFNSSYWQPVNENILRQFLKACVAKLSDVTDERYNYSDFQKKLYETFFMNLPFYQPVMESDVVMLNLRNCILRCDITGSKNIPHDKKYFFLYELDYDYDITATAEKFDTFLLRVLPDESSRLLLQELVGFALTRCLKLEKCAILYGKGRNGKSVFFEIIRSLFGNYNISTVPFKYLSEEHYLARIENSLINYCTELGNRVDKQIFKQIVSGEPLEARHKYGQPFTVTIYGKLMCNGNDLPTNIGSDPAFYSRVKIVHFTETIPDDEIDIFLADKIKTDELSGILNWAVVGMNRLLQTREFTKCEKSNQILEQYKKDNNSVALFIEERGYTPNKNVKPTALSTLFTEYKSFCEHGLFKALHVQGFAKELRNLDFEVNSASKNKTVVYATNQ